VLKQEEGRERQNVERRTMKGEGGMEDGGGEKGGREEGGRREEGGGRREEVGRRKEGGRQEGALDTCIDHSSGFVTHKISSQLSKSGIILTARGRRPDFHLFNNVAILCGC
jgi:hypothetical protein